MQKGIIVLAMLLCASCSVPKVMNQSGRVTPKGNVTGGLTYMANVSQETSTELTDGIKTFIQEYQTQDSTNYDQLLLDANAALVAYSIDPVAFGPQFYLKVGVYDRLELGYTRTKGTNMFSLQGQFLGYEKERDEESKKRWFGSIGMQYSWNKYNLPKFFGKVQSVLGYKYGRRDLLIPLNFSYSFGPNEKYGALGFGAVLGIHHIYYSFLPEKVFDKNGIPLQAVNYKNNFNSIGFFVNVKAGYKYAYIIPSLAVYYQRYGTYPLANQSTVVLDGFTFVPAISIQFNSIRKKSEKTK